MGKPIYVVTVTKQKYYMQGEGEGGQIQIYGLTSPSFLSYFKYLEEKILFWKQLSRFVLRTLQKIRRITVKEFHFL